MEVKVLLLKRLVWIRIKVIVGIKVLKGPSVGEPGTYSNYGVWVPFSEIFFAFVFCCWIRFV